MVLHCKQGTKDTKSEEVITSRLHFFNVLCTVRVMLFIFSKFCHFLPLLPWKIPGCTRDFESLTFVFKMSFNWGKRVSYLFFACLTKAKPNLSLFKDLTKKYTLHKKSLKKRTHKQGMRCRVSWKCFDLVKWRLSDKRIVHKFTSFFTAFYLGNHLPTSTPINLDEIPMERFFFAQQGNSLNY